MAGRTVCLLALLASIVVVAIAVPNSYSGQKRAGYANDLIVGAHVPYDRLVLRQYVNKAPMGMQVVSVQRAFAINRNERINLIRAIDQVRNGTGAYVHLVKGGTGTNNVTLLFQSQRGRGINFVVELYARP